jgi:hypothetical protein
LGWAYTRYADDLSFSPAGPIERIGYLLARVRHIAEDEGFAVNEKKTRVLKRAARQSVTGVVVNAHLATPRNLRRQLRAIVHNAARTGLADQNRQRRPDFRAWLRGMTSYVSMVNAAQAARLRDRLNSIS